MNHPVCAAEERDLLIEAQPPLLEKEGNELASTTVIDFISILGRFLISQSRLIINQQSIFISQPQTLNFSSVHIREHVVHRSQHREQIRNHPASAQQWQHLQVRKRRCADSCPVRNGIAVADEVITVVALSGLNCPESFTGGNHRPPTHIQKVCNERFDIVHCPS